jgi:hypothetical protein
MKYTAIAIKANPKIKQTTINMSILFEFRLLEELSGDEFWTDP